MKLTRRKQRPQATDGPHLATLCDVQDLGIQNTNFGERHNLRLIFLIDELDPKGEPLQVSLICTASAMKTASSPPLHACSWAIRQPRTSILRTCLEDPVASPLSSKPTLGARSLPRLSVSEHSNLARRLRRSRSTSNGMKTGPPANEK